MLTRYAVPIFAICCVYSPALAQTNSCPLNGVVAVTNAVKAGFWFQLLKGVANDCELWPNSSTFVISGEVNSPSDCHFALFGGRLLSKGWRITGFTISGDGYLIRRINPIGYILDAHARKGQTVEVSIETVYFGGGKCADIMSAFD